MSDLPPVFDYSDDPEAFDRHLHREMAKPCVHCDVVALVERVEIPNLFGGPKPWIEMMCTACGERRASFYPTP